MNYIVDVNGRRVEVELDGPKATINGKSNSVSLIDVEGTPVFLLRVGDEVHRVLAKRGSERGRWTIDVDGVRFDVEALDERRRAISDLTAATDAAAGPKPLIAPMPGLVVRVQVKVGDVVSAGQGLVVVEAMKMENELRAISDGVVLSIRAEQGAPVEKGAILVELGPIIAD